MRTFFLVLFMSIQVPAVSDASFSIGKLKPLELPKWPKQVLFVSDSLSLGLDNANLSLTNQQSLSESVSGQASASIRYNRSYESTSLGYSAYVSFEATGGIRVPSGQNTSEKTSGIVRLQPQFSFDARYYPTPKSNQLFLTVAGEASYYFLHNVSPFRSDAMPPQTEHSLLLSTYLGVGHGRIVDVSAAVRLRKMTQFLRKAGLIKANIPASLRRKIMLHWYALRNRIGDSLPLAHTMSILQQGGILLRKPTLFEIYTLIKIIGDPQISLRLKGWRSRIALDATFTVKDVPSQLGAHLHSIYGRLFGVDKALFFFGEVNSTFGVVGNSFASLSASFEGRFRWFLYNETMDPLGSLEFVFGILMGGVFSDNNTTVDNNYQYSLSLKRSRLLSMGGLNFTANLGATYSYAWTRATSFRVGMQATMNKAPADPFEISVMFNVGIAFGFVSGSYTSLSI